MSGERKESVAVVGAGSWGTAFAAMLAGRHESVTLWAHEAEVYADLRDRRENRAEGAVRQRLLLLHIDNE